MTRAWAKIALAGIVSFVMLYYSVAWAVLRCEHQDGRVTYGSAVNDDGAYGAPDTFRLPMLPGTNLDCQDRAFHFESLAGPSTFSALLRQLRETTPQTPNYSLLAQREGDAIMILRGGILPEKGLSPLVATNLPRYLLISTLRF